MLDSWTLSPLSHTHTHTENMRGLKKARMQLSIHNSPTLPQTFHRACASGTARWALLEVVRVLAEGQAQGVQSVPVVFLSAQQQAQQVEGVQVVPAQG